MTNAKKMSAVIILSALVATPAFARATTHSRAHDMRNFRGAYGQLGTWDDLNIRNVGFSGRDRSWVGGVDPSLRPAAN
jgi:hypothetical protein